jgi:Spy/CpxP family protein refolding chaperone
MIRHLIAHAKAKLNLNTMQQGMFDTAVADSKAAREAGRALHEKVKATLQAELAKPEPDLAAVAAAADAAVDQGRDKRKAIRAEWLALYATFTVEQKAVVKDMLQKRLAHAESFRQKMRERMHSMFDKSSG